MSSTRESTLVIIPTYNEIENLPLITGRAVSYTHLTLPTSDLV